MPAKNFEQKIDSLEKKMKRKEGREWNQVRGGPKGGEPAADPRFFIFFVLFEDLDALSKFILFPFVYIG